MDERGPWTSIKSIPADALECRVEGLQEDKRYKFRVSAKNKVGQSEPAELKEPVVAKNPWSPPGPPLNLEVTDWDKDRVDLSWQRPTNDGGAPITGYQVECKEKFSTAWLPCALNSEPVTTAKVKEVIEEGKTYEFRVRASNKAGLGQPSEPTKPMTIKSRFSKPFIVGQGMIDKVVKVDQTLSWDVQFGGEPAPDVQWMAGDKIIEPDGQRVTVENFKKSSLLTVRRCQRGDNARYKINLTNNVGQAGADADGVVLGKPSRPIGPLEVANVRAKKATLKWKAPEDDGGAPITHYQLERMDLDSGRWVPCGEAPADAEEAVVDGLQEGKQYKFRVRAVNKEGQSEALESEAVTAKNPYRVPDPPRELVIDDWDNKSVTLKWEVPTFDGGRPITHYIVEQKGKFDIDFVEVLVTPDASLDALVENLREKAVYQWRVRAVNKAGPGGPCEPTPQHLVKHRHSELILNKRLDSTITYANTYFSLSEMPILSFRWFKS